jgi:hypothetical protein
MLEAFEAEIATSWDPDDTVDEKVNKLNLAASNVYTEYCRKGCSSTPKQKYRSEELVSRVGEGHALWRGVKRIGDTTGEWGWEKRLKALHAANTELNHNVAAIPDQPFDKLSYGQWIELWTKWQTSPATWFRTRRLRGTTASYSRVTASSSRSSVGSA